MPRLSRSSSAVTGENGEVIGAGAPPAKTHAEAFFHHSRRGHLQPDLTAACYAERAGMKSAEVEESNQRKSMRRVDFDHSAAKSSIRLSDSQSVDSGFATPKAGIRCVSPRSGRLMKGTKQTNNPLTPGNELISHDAKKPYLSKAERPVSKEIQRKNDLDQLHPFERGVIGQTPRIHSSNRMRELLCGAESDRCIGRSASAEPSLNHGPAGRASQLGFTERPAARRMRSCSVSTNDYEASGRDSSCDTAFRKRDQNGAPMHIGGVCDLIGSSATAQSCSLDGVSGCQSDGRSSEFGSSVENHGCRARARKPSTECGSSVISCISHSKISAREPRSECESFVVGGESSVGSDRALKPSLGPSSLVASSAQSAPIANPLRARTAPGMEMPDVFSQSGADLEICSSRQSTPSRRPSSANHQLSGNQQHATKNRKKVSASVASKSTCSDAPTSCSSFRHSLGGSSVASASGVSTSTCSKGSHVRKALAASRNSRTSSFASTKIRAP